MLNVDFTKICSSYTIKDINNLEKQAGPGEKARQGGSGSKRDGVGRSGIEWEGARGSGREQDGVRWSGMEWIPLPTLQPLF